MGSLSCFDGTDQRRPVKGVAEYSLRCMNVTKCLCADGGDNCLSPKVFEDDLIGYFSFDEKLVADESGMLRIKPEVIPGPGYGNRSDNQP